MISHEEPSHSTRVNKAVPTRVVIISMNGYKKEIALLHPRHLPRSTSHDKTGILSYHAITFLHDVHRERAVKKEMPLVIRYETTLRNDPQHKKITISINIINKSRSLALRSS